MIENRLPPDIHKEALAALERKLHLVRDHVTAVARGYKSGYYLYGTGGMGKSYCVLRHLESLDVPYQLFNSRMTAKGLFLTLQWAPDAIHVLEDMERLTKDPDAQGVLRSALWAQPGHDRVVTWTTATDGKQRFVFRGGLILISNRPLADLPELRALATRIEVHRLEVSDAELAALMRELAAMGYRLDGKVGIGPEECRQVTEYLLKECRATGCPLDLRLQQKAFQSYLQFAADCSVSHWEDLVAASVREATCHFRHEQNTTSPEARKAKRRNLVRELIDAKLDAKDQEQEYVKRSGMSRADFFRRKREVESGEFDGHDLA
jgi:hypothetical protein